MSSPAWSVSRTYYANRREAESVLTSMATGMRRQVSHGFWPAVMSAKTSQMLSPAEFHALHGAPAASYMPFYLEGNNFFETPVCKAQLTMRALERSWSNPLWLRQETVDVLRLKAAPLEAPLGLWLPQCSDTFRPLSSLPPKVQHIILRDLPVNSLLLDTGHVVLALDYLRVLAELGGVTNGIRGGATFTPPMKPASMARPRYTWQQVTPQFGEMFDRAWAIAEPAVARQITVPLGSRSSAREVPPKHPRRRMWVSMRCAATVHSEAYRAFYALPFENITVKTPHHGGLFYNAAQLFPNELLQQKTLDVMARVAEVERKRGNPNVPEGIATSKVASHPFSSHTQVIQAIPDVLEAEGPLSAKLATKRAHIDGVEHAVNYDVQSALPSDSHAQVGAALDHSDDRDDSQNSDLDAMMLFADDDVQHVDVSEEEMNAADLLSGGASDIPLSQNESALEDITIDAVADVDVKHNELLFADQEDSHDDGSLADSDGVAAAAGNRVFIDTAAVHDSDGPLSYHAELEVVQELLLNEKTLGTLGDVEIDEVAAVDIATNHEGLHRFADLEDELLGSTSTLHMTSARQSHSLCPPIVATSNVTLQVAPLPIIGMSYSADPFSTIAATATQTMHEIDESVLPCSTKPFESGGIL